MDTTTHAPKPTQYRALGSAGVKSYAYRTEGLKHKFDKSGNLEVFCTNVWEHLQECGMDTIAYLPDPAAPETMMSVVKNHGRFNTSYTKLESTRLQQKWDRYDRNNDGDAKAFLLASLKADFKRHITQIVEPDDSFAIIWITVMRKLTRTHWIILKNL